MYCDGRGKEKTQGRAQGRRDWICAALHGVLWHCCQKYNGAMPWSSVDALHDGCCSPVLCVLHSKTSRTRPAQPGTSHVPRMYLVVLCAGWRAGCLPQLQRVPRAMLDERPRAELRDFYLYLLFFLMPCLSLPLPACSRA